MVEIPIFLPRLPKALDGEGLQQASRQAELLRELVTRWPPTQTRTQRTTPGIRIPRPARRDRPRHLVVPAWNTTARPSGPPVALAASCPDGGPGCIGLRIRLSGRRRRTRSAASPTGRCGAPGTAAGPDRAHAPDLRMNNRFVLDAAGGRPAGEGGRRFVHADPLDSRAQQGSLITCFNGQANATTPWWSTRCSGTSCCPTTRAWEWNCEGVPKVLFALLLQ